MKVQPLTPIIGAEVSGLDLCRLTDHQFDGLNDAFTEHSVLFLRDQNAMPMKMLLYSRQNAIYYSYSPPTEESINTLFRFMIIARSNCRVKSTAVT